MDKMFISSEELLSLDSSIKRYLLNMVYYKIHDRQYLFEIKYQDKNEEVIVFNYFSYKNPLLCGAQKIISDRKILSITPLLSEADIKFFICYLLKVNHIKIIGNTLITNNSQNFFIEDTGYSIDKYFKFLTSTISSFIITEKGATG